MGDSGWKLLTKTQVAERVQVTPKTIERWAQNGAIPSVKINNGPRRFYEKDLDRWLSAETAKQTSTAKGKQKLKTKPVNRKRRPVKR